ncbi:MAG: flagellar protein FliT [Chloroflexi bacterium]|nr:flagellar protein FliT [Chloroflexota bacterium]
MAIEIGLESPETRPMAFKVVLYEAIHRTAQAQHAALENDDLGTFYDLLVEREKLLEKVEQVGEMSRSLGTQAADLDRRDRSAAATLVRSILDLDTQSEQLLMDKIATARTELNRVHSGRKVLRAYDYLAPNTVNGLVDRRS